MRALQHRHYGDPRLLTVGERQPPSVGPDEVLVRVRAASLNAADWFMLTGRPFPARFMWGLLRPARQQLGLDVAGEVVAIGARVARVRPGDAVLGEARGTFAEYAVVAEAQLGEKPSDVSFEQAATLPVAGCTALQGLRDKARVAPGHRVLINGASGGVGSFAVQIARILGAEVTAVCSTANVARAREFGATHVIDYRLADFSETHARYDAIFDLVGNTSLRRCLALLGPQGTYVSSAGRLGWIAKVALASLWPRSRVRLLASSANAADLETLASLCAQGRLTPFIERRVVLDELPDALRLQGEGHAQGKTVVLL